jgi:hypothetical protein
MGYIKIRIRSTGQVTEMVPDVARKMISSGMADDLSGAEPAAGVATMTTTAERQAVAPAQTPAGGRLSPRRVKGR